MEANRNNTMLEQQERSVNTETIPCAKAVQANNVIKEPNTIHTESVKENSASFYDALHVSDTVISNLDVASANTSSDIKHNNSMSMGDNKVKNPPSKGGDKKNVNALSQLLEYMSDSEESHSDSDESLSGSEAHSDNEASISTQPNIGDDKPVSNSTNFRENASSSDSTSEYESDSSSAFSDIGACGGAAPPEKKQQGEKMSPPRTKGELTLEELPPIEELQISVAEEDCIEIGVVSSIIDQLVIVQSLRGTPAYDIDTLFFLNRGKSPLGRVFDVLGPVTEPLYAIRFNSYEQALETGVKTGTPVYCAPRTQHTSYVFVSELMKVKGSDASWEHNNEPPEVFLDYSDDEEERKARRLRKKITVTEANKSSSLERNRKFEKQMNDKNLLMTERYKSQQTITPPIRKKKPDNRAPGPVPGPNLGPAPPPAWLVRNPAAAPMTRAEFWPPQPQPQYQFAAYPPYGPMPMFPPRGHFVAPMLGPAPPAVFHAPFNPNVPPPQPPILRPQPIPYFAKPRHPPWHPPPLNLGVGVGIGVMQPPGHNFGNGSSYTQ